jgi:hypothetical protein
VQGGTETAARAAAYIAAACDKQYRLAAGNHLPEDPEEPSKWTGDEAFTQEIQSFRACRPGLPVRRRDKSGAGLLTGLGQFDFHTQLDFGQHLV